MDLLNLLPFQNGEAIDSVGVIIIGTTLVLLFIALRRLGKHKTSNNTQQNHKTQAEAAAEYEFDWEKKQKE